MTTFPKLPWQTPSVTPIREKEQMTTGYEVGMYRDLTRIADSLHELEKQLAERPRGEQGCPDTIDVNPGPVEVRELPEVQVDRMSELIDVLGRIADALEAAT